MSTLIRCAVLGIALFSFQSAQAETPLCFTEDFQAVGNPPCNTQDPPPGVSQAAGAWCSDVCKNHGGPQTGHPVVLGCTTPPTIYSYGCCCVSAVAIPTDPGSGS